ncbi:MAG TPA: SIS domain-containing protein [Candidatus Angelobacter sp.]|nr:SIS domain-containing protein [Candidatus Angelobacter sp.]
MSAYDSYYTEVQKQLAQVHAGQRKALEQAAAWLGEALVNDRWLYAFGTGHSHMLAEEIFYRAGGLAHAVPMLDDKLMLHENAIEATYVERQEGYAAGLLERYPVAAGDLLIVASNSGRNAVPIELALAGRGRGLKVVVITSLQQTSAWPSRHSSGKRLADAGDLVIDNCAVNGDACVKLIGMPGAVGPTSTVTGALIVNLIIVQGIENALARGVAPEIYISSNTTGDDHNNSLLKKYRSRIRHL